MANINISTHQMIATAAAKVLADTSPLFTTASREGENEFGKTVNKHKPGDTINIRVPDVGTVQSGATAVPSSVNETVVPLTIDIRENISFELTTHEQTLKMTDAERIVGTYAAQLAAKVHNAMMTRITSAVANAVTRADGQDDYFDASAVLSESLAPMDTRFAIVNPREKARVGKSLNNQWTQPSDVNRKSTIGMLAGFEMNESTGGIPSVVNGNKVASVAVSAVPSAGATAITLKGLSSGDTFLKGSTFTVAGVYAVNPLTCASTGVLRQFVVTADATSTGATKSVSVYPEMIVGKTVTALPAVDAALTFIGAANAVLNTSVAFNKDAFRLAFVPLAVPEDKKGYTLSKNGFSIRVYTGSDTLSDVSTTRLDIACGIAIVRPEWACKIVG